MHYHCDPTYCIVRAPGLTGAILCPCHSSTLKNFVTIPAHQHRHRQMGSVYRLSRLVGLIISNTDVAYDNASQGVVVHWPHIGYPTLSSPEDIIQDPGPPAIREDRLMTTFVCHNHSWPAYCLRLITANRTARFFSEQE